MNAIVVVGSLNIDLVAHVKKMPVMGETVEGLSFHSYPGGKGANQAVAASRLGASVCMIGRIGNDAFGSTLVQTLQDSGVNAESVRACAAPTGTAIVTVTQGGSNAIIVVPGANGSLDSRSLEGHRSVLETSLLVMCQLEIPLETVEYAAAIAQQANIPFILDPAPARNLPLSLLRRVTWLTPNETEALEIIQHLGHDAKLVEGPEAIAEKILQTGVRNVVLKLGSNGVFLAGKDVPATFVPAYEVDAVDTTAAGDAFNGGFAVALTRGFSPPEAARFAAAVAAISVTRLGAQPSMPELSEVDALQRRSARS